MKHIRSCAASSRWLLPVLIGAGWMMATAPAATAQSQGQDGAREGNFERCRAIPDATARLHCYEDADPALAPKARPGPSGAPENWRLVRTPNPGGGRDAVSIMRTADITRSDIDLAGLMLRCGENNTEVVVVLVHPIPPRAHPKVMISANGKSAEFTATVVPPGLAVLLPPGASALAAGPWQAAAELAIEIDDDQGPIRGIVSLAGLSTALRTLQSNCPFP